jgi:hypothetical protein
MASRPVASLLLRLLFLANYPIIPRRPSQNRAVHGRSEKEDLAVAPKYAAIASRAQIGCLR